MRRFDVVVGVGTAVLVVLATIGTTELQHGRFGTLDAGAIVLMVVAGLATGALRRVAPLSGTVLTVLAVFVYLVLDYPFGPVQLCLVVGLFELARQRPLRISLPVCLGAAALVSASVVGRTIDQLNEPFLLALTWSALAMLPWSLGTLVRVASTARERARRDLVAKTALEERMKIASEVHDVAGHGLSLVAMQAGVALLVFDEDPAQARQSLEAIQTTSTAALTDLRGMLEAIYPDDPDAGLAGLNELVDGVRAAGLPVELEVADLTGLDASVDAIAYRVVRESLTNVVRHAGPTRAEVRISRQDKELLVRVHDGGRGAPSEVEPGHGLAGLRRRVEAAGGSFAAEAGDGGGFVVTATLPLAGPR